MCHQFLEMNYRGRSRDLTARCSRLAGGGEKARKDRQQRRLAADRQSVGGRALREVIMRAAVIRNPGGPVEFEEMSKGHMRRRTVVPVH